MANDERTELNRWVEARLGSVAPPPGWEPDLDLARARTQARLGTRRPAKRYWLTAAAAACVLCGVVLLAPATRAFAQQLWRWMTVGRIEIARVDFDRLPREASSLWMKPLGTPGAPQAVADVDQAARLAGFAPRLPSPAVLSGSPRISVLAPIAYSTVLRTQDLQLALQNAGVSDAPVPDTWDGARIAAQVGSTVSAEWEGIALAQALPVELSVPSGFDLGAFLTDILRASGMNASSAQQFGQRLAASPALLFGIPANRAVTIRSVNLDSGPGTLIESAGVDGEPGRVTLLWSVPDRVYVLRGRLSADLATAVANSMN
jgi:hypothetical protein